MDFMGISCVFSYLWFLFYYFFILFLDIIAVLCPKGPLKMLINIIHDRNEQLLPSMIYSSMAWVTMANETPYTQNDLKENEKVKSTLNENNQMTIRRVSGSEQDNIVEQQIEETGKIIDKILIFKEFSGFKLGLGDFIFYSVLIGKATVTHDWNTIYACLVGILAV